jgi:D-tagatose-1,6-bisphosphate aldolase subunit GatZ/KbaZ
VENPEAYPAAGVAAANVGPEFSEREYEGLMALAAAESVAVDAGRRSGIRAALGRAVVDSGRWRKLLLPDERRRDFEALSPARRAWLTRTGARYVWTAPEVVRARKRLRENLRSPGRDPEAEVRMAIERSMDRYFRAFGLRGANRWI